MDKRHENYEHSSTAGDDVHQDAATLSISKITPRRKGIRFTDEEDNCIRLGTKQFGLCWSKILRNSEFNFNACRVANSLRKRAEALKLV